MKVKEFLDRFSDFDPESELKFELFEEERMPNGDFEEVHTPLDVADANYLDETDTVFLTLGWGDWEIKEELQKD